MEFGEFESVSEEMENGPEPTIEQPQNEENNVEQPQPLTLTNEGYVDPWLMPPVSPVADQLLVDLFGNDFYEEPPDVDKSESLESLLDACPMPEPLDEDQIKETNAMIDSLIENALNDVAETDKAILPDEAVIVVKKVQTSPEPERIFKRRKTSDW